MSDALGPLDRLLDAVMYAPLGLAIRAREEVPKLAAQGRKKFTTEASLARMVGQMAVAQGRRRAGQLLTRPGSATKTPEPQPRGRPVAVRDLKRDGDRPGRARAVAGEDPPDAVAASEPATAAAGGPSKVGDATPSPPPAAPDAADLPIPGYDSLSASQVVQRLPGLSPAELEAVRAYEAEGRARKTVLLRVAQLRATS